MLSQSEFTEFRVHKNCKKVIQKFHFQNSRFSIGQYFKVSFFASVPLDITIDVILRQIYREKAIVTNVTLNEIKELVLLCAKNGHFSFNG